MGNRQTFLYQVGDVISHAVTQEDRRSGCWMSRSKQVGGSCR